MYTILSLIDRLVDSLFPPPGGAKADIDAKFDDLVGRYHAG